MTYILTSMCLCVVMYHSILNLQLHATLSFEFNTHVAVHVEFGRMWLMRPHFALFCFLIALVFPSICINTYADAHTDAHMDKNTNVNILLLILTLISTCWLRHKYP